MNNTALSLINKNILVVALMFVSVRMSSFSVTHIPKPFEFLIGVLCLLSVYLFFKRGTKFFQSIPRHIFFAVSFLFVSIAVGWAIGVGNLNLSFAQNAVLEFGTFTIGVVTMFLILFYTKYDTVTSRRILYALLLPVLYALFVLIPTHIPRSLLLADGNFIGLSANVNYFAKILLIPALFFTAYTIVSRSKKLLFAIPAILTMTLLFWISSRGALVSLTIGLIALWIVVFLKETSWKKMVLVTMLLLTIVSAAFFAVPYSRKQVIVNRVLNSDEQQFTPSQVKTKPLHTLVTESLNKSSSGAQETRLQIWTFYIKSVLLKHPFGIGPNTHIASPVLGQSGEQVSSGPHNTYLEVWLWGGAVGFFAFCYLLFSSLRTLGQSLWMNFDRNKIALFVVLIAMLVAIIFDDSLSFYPFWVLLALSYRI